MTKKKPKVSIIIAALNSKKALEETILSILQQSYQSIEIVIIDGGSTDNTVEILKNYESRIKNNEFKNLNQGINFFWQSEKDKGISDAFNKGVLAAKGDYINFQGAGDLLVNKNVIEEMLEDINPKKDMLVCGRVQRVTKKGKILYTTEPAFSKWRLLYKMALPHQGLFTNKRFFQKFGLFSLDCKYAMDYELLLRAYKNFPKVIMKDIIVSSWQEGGIGQDKIIEILEEYHKNRTRNQVAPKWLLKLINSTVHLRYFLKKG